MAQYHSAHTGQQIDAAVTLVNTCTDTDSSTGNVPSSSNKLATVNIVNSVLPIPASGDDGKYLKVTESGQSYTWDIGVPDSADIPYDNTSSGLQATNLQDAIDEAISLVPDGLIIYSYGQSTFAEVLDGFNRRLAVYCKASSNSNPGTGVQNRMAFLAYVNYDSNSVPQEFEFQYYRSVSSHTYTTQGDQVFIYKLNKNTGWSVTTRSAFTKIVIGDGLEYSFTNGVNAVMTVTNPVTASWVNGQIADAITDAIAAEY